MTVYFVTGKLGSGKSLVAVSRIREYLQLGRKVATNLNLNFEHINTGKSTAIRLPDRPTRESLDMLGTGNDSYDETLNGLVVLDECACFLNARHWQDKGRLAALDWFLHARKLGWDLIFIVQDLSVVDKQYRVTLCEHLVICQRLDRIKLIPLIRFPLPRLHIGRVYYGDTHTQMIVDRWIYRGTSIFKAYDTKQVFLEDNNSMFSYLSYHHLVGRYKRLRDWARFIRQFHYRWLPALFGGCDYVPYVGCR